MLDWEALSLEHQELIAQLSSPSLDPKERSRLQKRAAQLDDLLLSHRRIKALDEEISQNKALEAIEADAELKKLYAEEIAEAEKQRNTLEEELDELLYPPDERDDRSVFIEIRAGAGGQEAALFVADLARMYQLYAVKKNWDVSLVVNQILMVI